MQLQRKILENYRVHYGNLSFREIALQTGIQQTRVFRIFNGSEMKLSEFEIFRNLTTLAQSDHAQLELLVGEACQKLSTQALLELETQVRRKLELWNLVNQYSDQQNLAA